MNNYHSESPTPCKAEFNVRQVMPGNLPGKLLAGPFSNEHEAREHQKQVPGSRVFQEAWFS